MRFHLDSLFNPRSVAVVGASDDPAKLGFHVMKSLVEGGYRGLTWPVNPGRREVMGRPACSSVAQTPHPPDLAILVVPAARVVDQVRMCAQRGVRSIVIISAGFKELDDASGADLQDDVARLATEARIPVVGPNTFGLVNLHAKLNASFTPQFSQLEPGHVTLLSQSGGMSHLLAFLGMGAGVGFSKVVGLGNRCNVEFAHLLEYLVEDPTTRVIAMYVEGLDAPRALLEETRRLRGRKPMVIYKVGKGDVADLASRSHTGSLAGRHELYQGAFRQAGLLTADSAEALLDASVALARCPLPAGRRVAILSGQAGPAVAACDVCEAEGLAVIPFQSTTQEAIDQLLPPLAMRTNPVDMGPAWHDSVAMRAIVQVAMEAPDTDAILLLIMFASANEGVLRALSDLLTPRTPSKPIVACLSAPPGVWERELKDLVRDGALVNYPTPERAARALAFLWSAAGCGR